MRLMGVYKSENSRDLKCLQLSAIAMGATDPAYPLYPIANIVAAGMVLLVLLTSFVRQSWNLGVAFLCFWLFLENLIDAANAIIWSDNADIKFHAYCDIGMFCVLSSGGYEHVY